MARKQRDYKAEYRRSKERAQASGYKSEREYKAVRKALGTPRGAMPAPRRVMAAAAPERLNAAQAEARAIAAKRRAAASWSKKHSHVGTSAYTKRMTDSEVEAYYRAYLEPLTGLSKKTARDEKRRRIKEYMVSQGLMTPSEWEEKYPK